MSCGAGARPRRGHVPESLVMADAGVNAPMQRILVVGCAGSGKTTFACRLGAALGLPVIHLDYHYWRPGWEIPDLATWRGQVEALAATPQWVMDGNYSNTYDIRLPRADSLVWLDHPRSVCMRRILLRTARGFGTTRPELPAGCPERFNVAFLRYVWSFPREHRPRIDAGIARFGSHLRVTRLARDGEVRDFLARLITPSESARA
jgi:adenylate kinase family enzyme